MGSPLQEILPGRGDKKGSGLGWIRYAAVAAPFAVWLGLLIDSPLKYPSLWFSCAAAALVFNGFAHFFARQKAFALEFLVAALLLSSGVFSVSGMPWLKLSYFPLLIGLTRYYGLNVVVPLSVLVPFIEMAGFFSGRIYTAWEVSFFAILILTTALASLIFNLLRNQKDRAEQELEKIKAKALDRTQDTEMESMGSDEIISHYFASKIRANEEILEILNAIKHTVVADAVHFFEPQGDSFTLRCSTDDKGRIMITGKGIMAACLRERRPFFSGELDEKNAEIGYIRDIKILSLIVMPVMEGSTPVGLLAVDTARYQAFNEPEQKTVKIFSAQVAKILERERLYNVMKHDITALRIIKEFSSTLAESIHYEVVVQKLCDYAKQAFAGDAFFIEHDDNGFTIKRFPGEVPSGSGRTDFGGTLVGLAIENKQKEYVSDIRKFTMKILPQQIRVEGYRSVIAIPLFNEGKPLGVFGMLSQQREFLDSRQISLVEVMCNQATTSIANARMHAEIERMATTDGLTGLLNHRVFQQKLTEELKRSERYSSPLSLLLTDIDFFKKVNDTYGHPAGDLVLKGVSRILREEIRDIDVAARYGGEEFAVILPGTDGPGARNIAERLRKAIMAETFSIDSRTLKVTTSIGIATVPADAGTKEELIEKTDQALYHAKHNGRNQSVNWGTIG